MLKISLLECKMALAIPRKQKLSRALKEIFESVCFLYPDAQFRVVMIHKNIRKFNNVLSYGVDN